MRLRFYDFIYAAATLALLAFLGACSEQIAEPVLLDEVPNAPEVPRNLETVVGDGTITLSWTVGDPAQILRYLIYRGDTTRVVPELIDSSTTQSYTDSNLRNSLRYIYQVAAVGRNGLLGKPSRAVSATPNIYGVTINNGAKFTNRQQVSLAFAASANTRLVEISDQPSFDGTNWSNFTGTKDWIVPIGDGNKAIYARFRDSEGNEVSSIVSDEIILDTRAVIASVTEDSDGKTLVAGDQLVITLYAGEIDGKASAQIANIAEIELFDINPETDDALPDGIYSAAYTVPANLDAINATITGSFNDAAGNQAAPRAAVTVINIASPPQASILTAALVSEQEIELAWTRSNAADFQSYQVYRSETSTVNRTSLLVRTETNVSAVSFRDSDLDPGKDYYFVVYTNDRTGLSAASNSVKATTTANVDPKAVSLFKSDEDSTRIVLGWTRNDDEDFESYRVYRSQNSGVTINAANLVGVVPSQSSLSFTDNNINVGQQFYYIVVVFDKFGARSAASNEVRGPNP